jgi:diacylglycerol O-acyltransferase
MARYAYDRLTALDNSFLALERPNAYMHVASTMIMHAGPLKKPDGGIDALAIRRLVESHLHMIPRYRQKLEWIPLFNHPVWVDDPRFKLDYHVRHTALPRPGNDEQLKALSARIMEQHLDRRRPLWEMWIVEGLEGDRFAIINKVHHCMIDGVSGVDILRVLMSMTPEVELHDSPAYIPRRAPSTTELLQHEVARQASLPLRVLSGVSHVVAEAEDIRRNLVTGARQVGTALGGSLRPAVATPLNDEIGPHRRFDWLVMSLDEIKTVRKSLGGSLNDIVLTVVTGAVRRFLKRRQCDPARIHPFRVMAPVSVRNDDERGQLGNRVSAWLVDLPIDEADPRKQLDRVSRITNDLKNARGAVAAEILTQAAEWTPSTLLSLAGRNVSRWLPFNMVVTNVPGPQFPMYMMGAEMETTFPHVPLTDNLGLGIALMSYNGRLCWGFNADYDLVPDLKAFIGFIRDAFDDLKKAAAARTTGPGRPAPVELKARPVDAPAAAGQAPDEPATRH